ncbi:MAG: glutaminase [Paracoccaceae bacterium]
MGAVEPGEIQEILDHIAHDMGQETERGQVATYIPELARQSTDPFGIAVALPGGQVLQAGDSGLAFSIQSISKVFTLAIALGRLGDQLWNRVGREPSGHAFNSILQLEHEDGIPRNPFVNAGAIVVTDAILAGHQPREVLGEVLRFIRLAAEDEDIHINKAVAASERATAHRNIALAEFMAAHGNMRNPVELTIGTYVHQCAVEMTCAQLARAGLFLVGGPGTPRLVSPARTRRINALMMTCGHYDGSGEFAYRVGLPGKSGVGGGILAIAPGRAAIATWSPGLNPRGNSALGTLAMERLARATGWSVFG